MEVGERVVVRVMAEGKECAVWGYAVPTLYIPVILGIDSLAHLGAVFNFNSRTLRLSHVGAHYRMCAGIRMPGERRWNEPNNARGTPEGELQAKRRDKKEWKEMIRSLASQRCAGAEAEEEKGETSRKPPQPRPEPQDGDLLYIVAAGEAVVVSGEELPQPLLHPQMFFLKAQESIQKKKGT